MTRTVRVNSEDDIEISNYGNVPRDVRIEWMYPDIYEGKHRLILGLCHVRATDAIRIHYESERDGWVIEQASKFEWEPDDKICDPGWKEVAFIQAWASDSREEKE